MLKVLTKKLRNQTLNEIQPFQLKVKVDGVVSCRVGCSWAIQVTRTGDDKGQ